MAVPGEALRHLHLGHVAGDEVLGLGADEDADGAAGEERGHGGTATFATPEKSAETLRADGWLRTGDLATMDERGYCRIVGRLKDMIIRGGENLFPAEIEEVLYRHPGVAEVAVVGLPDERWGEVVGAFIRPRDPNAVPTVAELRSHLRAHLSPQKTPTRWYAVDGYPLTGSGKIQKFAVRQAWERGEHAGHELGG